MVKNQKILITLILFLTAAVCVDAMPFADDAPQMKASKLNANTLRISGVTNAISSPSGKFLAVQSFSKFSLLATQNLNESIENLNERDGKIIGFLPSDTLIYAANGEVLVLDPANRQQTTARKIFSGNSAQNLIEPGMGQSEVVIVSNDLIVSGSGSYDWGGDKGNIYRYDLKTKRTTKGAKVWGFWYASRSPSGKYILYEHGAEDNNNADLYHVLQNRNYPIAEYFNFRRVFPKLSPTNEVPIGWLAGKDRFLAEITSQEDDLAEPKGWLVLFDAAARKIIWKKSINKFLFPTDFQQLNADKALLRYDDSGVYELSLRNGAMRRNAKIDGDALTVSPDGKSIVLIEKKQVFNSSPDGRDKKQILELPPEWKPQTVYKGMGTRPPLWSAGGDWLIIFGENDLLLTQL
jgi:hypothetical protein